MGHDHKIKYSLPTNIAVISIVLSTVAFTLEAVQQANVR